MSSRYGGALLGRGPTMKKKDTEGNHKYCWGIWRNAGQAEGRRHERTNTV